jgi:isochorismate synthase
MSDRPDLRLVEGGFADGLHVRCAPLGPAFDLLAAYRDASGWFFEHDGTGVAAVGGGLVELTAPMDREGIQSLARSTVRGLRALDGDPGVVAVGAIGFDAGTSGRIEIPRTAVRRDPESGARLVQILAEGEEPPPFAPDRLVGSFPHQAFDASRVHPEPSEEAYLSAVRDAVTRIRAGELEKVVLARTVVVDADWILDPRRLAHRLRAVEPNAYAFAVPTPRGTLVGASPELLIRRADAQVWSTPLAGSAPRSGDPDEDRANGLALLESAKERKEHALVVDAIAETLSPLCERLEWDPDPVLLETANVWHLATRFEGELRDPAPSALELVGELHPTPAVCGTPSDRALELIGRLEPFERGCYAGATGWMDASGDGEWAIALRCAELDGERATLYAGAGIVAGSVAERELDETERKFRAFLDSLRWG